MKAIRIACTGAAVIPYDQLQPFQGELKSLSETNYIKFRDKIIRLGFSEPISVWRNKGNMYILNGHQRLRTVRQMVEEENFSCPPLPVSWVEASNYQEAKRKVLSLTSQFGEIEKQGLYEFMHEAEIPPGELEDYHLPEVDVPKFTAEYFDNPNGPGSENEGEEKYGDGVKGSMAEKFGAPPFSILDTKQGYWKARKQAWLDIGLNGKMGRENHGVGEVLKTGLNDDMPATSVFDPVLCELVYNWFTPLGGRVLDPFAGEATKGIVAAALGYPYTGMELREEQVEDNEAQWVALKNKLQEPKKPTWLLGDSLTIGKKTEGQKYDLVFTSPPYYDLEVYSKKENDGSTFGTYSQFMEWYKQIFKQCVDALLPDRFLVVKVGEIRDKNGIYHNFVGDNIACFKELGLHYYNEFILATPIGTLPLRAGQIFCKSRKVGKSHQNVLVFFKGNPAHIKDAFPQELASVELPTEEN